MGDQGETMNVNYGFDELPIEIIQHIQSFLARRDAANAGLLSKYWYDAWSTRPILDFSDVLFSFDITEGKEWNLWQSVRRTVQRYKQSNLKLEKLVLTIDSNYRHPLLPVFERFVDELFEDASTLGVNELHSTQNYGFGDHAVFPADLAFAIRSLTKLFVCSGISSRGPMAVQCPCLVSLRLHSVHIRNEDIQDILLGCPLIENLDIQCYTVTYIDVSNLHNLVVLNIRPYKYCHNYVTLSIESSTNGGITEFHRLCSVCLTKVEINDAFFQNFSSRFPCIEDLALDRCIGYEDIHISSKSLKSITLRLKDMKVEKAEFDVPNIRRFEFKSPDIPALSFQTVSREWESHVKLSCTDENLGVSNWFLRLREFLQELRLSRLYLHLKLDTLQTIWGEKIPRSPPVVVENLVLNYHPRGQDLFYALFCCCHPKVIAVLYFFDVYAEAYDLAKAFQGLFKHRNRNWFTKIHKLVKIDVEILQDSEWQIIPLLKFVKNSANSPDVEYIRFRLEWGDLKCT